MIRQKANIGSKYTPWLYILKIYCKCFTKETAPRKEPNTDSLKNNNNKEYIEAY